MGTWAHREGDIFKARSLDFIRVAPVSHASKVEVVSFLSSFTGALCLQERREEEKREEERRGEKRRRREREEKKKRERI